MSPLKPVHQLVIVVCDHRGYPESVYPNLPKWLKHAKESLMRWNSQFPKKPRHLRWYRHERQERYAWVKVKQP